LHDLLDIFLHALKLPARQIQLSPGSWNYSGRPDGSHVFQVDMDQFAARFTKRGNRYLRRLLINGASANLLRSRATKADPWVIGLRRRRPPLVVAVALANKTARIAWAVMLRQNEYQPRAVAA
jgi:hypothetical protein